MFSGRSPGVCRAGAARRTHPESQRMPRRFDVIVLGAGMVGVGVAVHLQQRGRAVALVDRKPPGSETSMGNAGLIQREGAVPYAFPRDLATLLRYARNTAPELRYHLRDLPALAPFLWSYWRNSEPARHRAIARAYEPLIRHCLDEHRDLAAQAGALALLRPSGWMRVYRGEAALAAELLAIERTRQEFGVAYEALDAAALQRAEPALRPGLAGAVRYIDPVPCSDPQALVQAYAAHLRELGGELLQGDAATLREGWSVQAEGGPIQAPEVVVALGPWAQPLTRRLGLRLPLAVKRGYHMHYGVGGPALRQPVLDAERGYLLAPMRRGLRLTTGAELARLDAAPTPRQLDAVEPLARELLAPGGLGERLDPQPWMGQRPCTPDMMPLIGPAPRLRGLWLAHGHAHHGFTLGPVTGRLLAEMMCGQPTLVDPTPYLPSRFA